MAADCRGTRALSRYWYGLLACFVAVVFSGVAPAASPSRDLAQIRAQLAVEYSRVGNLKAALDSATEAVSVDPGYMPGHLLRANVLQQLGVDGDAEQSFLRALALAPASPEANNNYGWFLCQRGRADESLAYFKRALADPLYDTPQTARLNLGVCLNRLDRKVEANEQFLAALQIAPAFPRALAELARLHLEQGNGKLAGRYLDRRTRIGVPLSADELLLGVAIARLNGEVEREQQLAGQLTSRFPDSRETQQLLSGL
ncbi:type IV pilus biogenesis/stability protein PilW [Crenobacter sp. SG2303]|uniref:Type IV pilus biogenesis/stability protein PilW n=1 Tax=Crenobacter oryzisoli TaxID=3056844 RepID=A0ABT7XRL4_9NEIS|nr:type IV pilus biogenesis/stability protein PilW [Crenobacter sp. SG2303]MDN0076442.1 type IV pilus biogenesis/stability protein PilW [Crenobacter sp. SG2303]